MTKVETAKALLAHWLERFEDLTGDTSFIVAVEPISYDGSLMSRVHIRTSFNQPTLSICGGGHWVTAQDAKLPRIIGECATDIEAYFDRVARNDEEFELLTEELGVRLPQEYRI